MEGEVPQQAGNNHPTSIPACVGRTLDGCIKVSATWQYSERRARAVGAPELITIAEYATARPARKPRRTECGDRAPYRTQHRAPFGRTLNAAGIPCGPVYSID